MSRKIWEAVSLLCFAMLFLVSAGVAYSSASVATLFSAIGGAEWAGCKAPCSDGGVIPVIECYDIIRGQPCNIDYCAYNETRVVKCAVGAAGSDELPCKTKSNPNDWWRRITIRREACTDEGGSGVVSFGDNCTMTFGGGNSSRTPCKTTSCSTGPIQQRGLYLGRMECDI